MVIRCERCSTMYELDESLLAPTGSEVQCTKCQHVFTAFPSSSPGRTLAGVPAQAQPQSPAPPRPGAAPTPAAAPAPRPPPPARSAAVPPTVQGATAGGRADAAPPRAVRTSSPSVYRPQASTVPGGSAPVTRAPVLKRDTVGTFEARLRWSARWRWLAPLVAVAVVAVIGGAWALLGRRGDAGAERTRAEALALVALDDGASVEEAVSRLSAIVKKRPKLGAAAADRALALVVRAAGLMDEAEALSARAAAARDERERARREQPPGWQEVERAASAEASALEPEVRAREEKTRAVSSGARDQLAILQAEAGDTPEGMRAQALLLALTGERDRLHKTVRAAREKGSRDPWIDLADGWGDARDPDRAARERALVKLGAVAAARPDLVRGRYLLARAQLSLGRKSEALATADGVLAANPKHEGARRLREELTAPPPPPQQQPAAQAPVVPPPAKPASQPRKIVSQPGPATSPAVPGGTPGRVPTEGSLPTPQQPATAPSAVPAAPARPSATPTPQEAPATALPEPPAPETAAPPPPPPPPPRKRVAPPPPSEPDGG